VEVVSHAIIAVLEHFGRLLLDDPHRFEPDRLVAAIRAVLGVLGSASTREAPEKGRRGH
jgi:hypothetical protein